MTAPIGITLSLDGVQATEQGLRRVAGGVDAVGVSAKQTAAALRGVPAQFTDIVTSLASGQQPLTVFLQQGGQLKDMFGGAGNAAKALGGYVAGLISPFTLAAAAGVALAVAYKQGSAEADAYARSIALTGNAAGVTASQLQGMAERVSAVAGTQSKAAEVVAQLVGTGSVASQSLEQFTATAIRLERNAGVAVKDTVKEFAELGKEPVEAAKKLNERYNYLTAAVYEQIKALQEQGKASEAAALSQQSYDKAMSLVASTLEGRLGYIERAWRAVGDASKWAWDKMLNVGRPDTLKDQLDRARANLEQRLNTPLAVDNPAMRASREKGIEALRNEINLLQEQERMMRRGADAQADRAKAEKAGIDAADALLKTQDKGLTKQQQMNAALKEYRSQLEALRAVNPNSARLAPDAVARGERAIRDQFKDQAGASTGESELATIKAKITETEKYIEALRTQGLEGAKLNDGERMALKIKEDLKTSITGTARANKELALVEAEKLGLVQRAAAAEEQRQKAVKKSTDEYAKLVESTFKAADALQDQADKQQAANAVYGKGAAAIDELALATLKSRMSEAQASDSFSEKYIAALEAQIQAQERLNAARAEGRFKEMNESLDRELAAANQQAALYQDELRLTGLSALERAKIVALRQSELELARDLEKIEQGGFKDAEKEQLRIIAREKQRVAGSAAVNKVIQDDFTRTSETIERSLTDALLRGFESGKGFAKNLRDTIANMFKTLVLRPIISAVVNPVAGALTGALGLAGTASAGTSALGAVSTAASGASLLGNAAGLLGGAGTAAGYGFSALMSGNGLGALSGGLGMLTSGGPAAIMAQGAGMIAGVLGPIALGIGALTAIIGKTKGETRTGGQFGVAFDGSVTNQRRGQTYTIEGQQFDRDFTNGLQTALKDGIAYRLEGDPVAQESAIREAVAGTASGINGFLKALGSSATLTGFSAGFETSIKDRGGNFAGGVFNTGATFGESGKGDNYAGTLYEKFSTNSPDFKTALENFTLDLKQSTIQALQTVTDIPQAVQKLLKGVDAEGLTEDAANKLLETINAQIVGVTQFKDALKGMGLDTVAALSFDAAAGLAEVSGGFDKLLGNLQTYYTNFFSGEEQRANLQRSLAEQLSTLGLQLPDINATNARDQYRALVQGAEKDLSESGRKTYATLLALSGAFASITEAAKTTTQTLEQQRQAYYGALQDAVSARNKSLQSQLSAAREVEGALDSLFGILRSNVRDLYGEVDGTRGMLASQGNAFIDQALATAKASG
ncbi:phage tail length tape measure family protein [Acidovorax sp. LjRoot74]|uniref:phage tail length tape measure family protein n=1 Tax=Acidovorax sp. LjRoot74 TaxID=3342337 RepID=UPI003ECF85B2